MIKRKEGPKADRQKDLDALKMNKISALPEFYDKVHNQLQRMLDNWVEESKEVKDAKESSEPSRSSTSSES